MALPVIQRLVRTLVCCYGPRERRSTAEYGLKGLGSAAAAIGPTSVCQGLVQFKAPGSSNGWTAAWIQLHESSDKRGILDIYEVTDLEMGPGASPSKLIKRVIVDHVERAHSKACCLLVQTKTRSSDIYLQFKTENDLYHWLDELYTRCPSSGVVDYESFAHNLHVRLDERGRGFTGFPRTLTDHFEETYIAQQESKAKTPSSTPPSRSVTASTSTYASTQLVTPETTLPDANIEVVDGDDFDIEIPRVYLPDDHIGLTPSRIRPRTQLRRPIKPTTDAPGQDVISIDSSDASRPTRKEPRDLTERVRKLDKYPVASGGYSDVYLGHLEEFGSVRVIGIKVLRAAIASPIHEKKLLKRLRSEIKVWERLHHPHIVELLGTCRNFGTHPALISPWYENGNVMHHISKLEEPATLASKLKLILDIAKGLQYLHGFVPKVVHGDIKGANVLVDLNGCASLTDFGLSSIFEDLVGSAYTTGSDNQGCSIRWMAVELICTLGEESGSIRFTPQTDIYSFGSTMLEILTEQVPYPHCKRDAQVVMDIYRGARHRREATDIPLDIWTLLERCWDDIPDTRPSASELIYELEYLLNVASRSLM